MDLAPRFNTDLATKAASSSFCRQELQPIYS